MIPGLQRVDHNKVFELMELKRLCCCSAGPHSAYRCTAVVTFASADQWDPARLDSIGAASSAVAPDRMQPCCNPERTAALKSTIRKQSAPTKPAFSDSSMATRCPADRPGWSRQDGGLRERRGRRLTAWWSLVTLQVQRSQARGASCSCVVTHPDHVALTSDLNRPTSGHCQNKLNQLLKSTKSLNCCLLDWSEL